MEDSVPVSAALLLGSAALGNGGRIQMPDIRDGDPAKRAAIQCGGQIVDAVKRTVDGIARFQPGFLECHMGQSAVMEMGMRDTGIEKVGVFQHAGMKLRAVNTGPDEGWGADPAHSKGAVLECGTVKIRALRQAVNVHLVKIGFPEELRWEACLGRPVEQLLIDDLQGASTAAFIRNR